MPIVEKRKETLCKCKKFGGYTKGYVCRICKKPIYSKKRLEKIYYERDITRFERIKNSFFHFWFDRMFFDPKANEKGHRIELLEEMAKYHAEIVTKHLTKE